MNDQQRAALAYFGVREGQPVTYENAVSLFASVQMYHHDQAMLSRDVPHLRALCGEPAILRASVEA